MAPGALLSNAIAISSQAGDLRLHEAAGERWWAGRRPGEDDDERAPLLPPHRLHFGPRPASSLGVSLPRIYYLRHYFHANQLLSATVPPASYDLVLKFLLAMAEGR